MLIAEVSKKYDISADTLRYYERIGLLPPVHRNESGNRDYTEENCYWVQFIKCMKSAGLSIESLIEYVALYQQGESTYALRKELLTEQKKILIAKKNEIQEVLERLDYKITNYDKLTSNKKI